MRVLGTANVLAVVDGIAIGPTLLVRSRSGIVAASHPATKGGAMTPGAVVIDGYYVEFEGGPYDGPATLGTALFDWPLPARLAVAVEDGQRIFWDADAKRSGKLKAATVKTVAVYRKVGESSLSLAESRALGRLRGVGYVLESQVGR